MFKIAKLNDVKNEIINISYVNQEEMIFDNSKKIANESFKTLSFEISGDNYCFSFELNCKLEELLKFPLYEKIDFSKYIFGGETWLNIKKFNAVEPEFTIKIVRYLKNKFIIIINFYTDFFANNEDVYSGIIEFEFNLDDYL